MKPFFFLLSLFLLFPVLLQAQANYKPGYVVTLEGDTVRGYLNYKEWTYTPSLVYFREDANSGAREKEVTPANTRYFEITGMEAYRRYEGKITMNPVAIARTSYETKTLLEPAVIFLKRNYEGDQLDLLSYTDQVKTRFFFQEKDGSQPQELYYNRYYANSNSNEVIVQKGYIGQLKFLVNKYDLSSSVLDKEIEYAQYTETDLVNIFNKINKIRVSSPAPKDLKGNSTRYFAGLGLNSSTVRFTGIVGLHVPESNPVSFMPRATFGADIFLNRYIQKLYFRVEGALTAANYHAENEIDQEQKNYRFSYKIAQQSFSVSPQLIYSLYNTDNFKFHLGLIGQISLSTYSKNVFKQDYTYTYKHVSSPPVHESVEYTDYLKLEPFWFTYAFRAGAVLNRKYELYAIYAPYASIAPYYSYNVEVRSLHVGMNYLFNK